MKTDELKDDLPLYNAYVARILHKQKIWADREQEISRDKYELGGKGGGESVNIFTQVVHNIYKIMEENPDVLKALEKIEELFGELVDK